MEQNEIHVQTYIRQSANQWLNLDFFNNEDALPIVGMEETLKLMAGMDNNNYTDQRFTPTSAIRDWATTVEGAATTANRNQSWANKYIFSRDFELP